MKMPNSSHVHGLVAGTVLAVFTLALVAIFLTALDESSERKAAIRESGLYTAAGLFVGVPVLNTLYIVTRKRLQ